MFTKVLALFVASTAAINMRQKAGENTDLQTFQNVDTYSVFGLGSSTCPTQPASVSCGGHSAPTCTDCPQGNGSAWCNGQCKWMTDKCIDPTQPASVSCGGHSAPTCADCPQGNGSAWCNGECKWMTDKCIANSISTTRSHADEGQGYSAPSSHMGFNDQDDGDMIELKVRVPNGGDAWNTYYEVLGWQGKAAGYCGIQKSTDGGFLWIFSIWDNGEQTRATEAMYVGEGTEISRFGGEGTGLKSMNRAKQWKVDQWYTLTAQAQSYNNQTTQLTFWFGEEGQEQFKMVTMEVFAPDAWFRGGTGSFLEDWTNSGCQYRKMELKDGFKRMAGSGKYIYFNQGRYSVNEWDLTGSGRSINYATAYNGGLNGKNFFMESGGNAQPDQGVTNPDTFNALS